MGEMILRLALLCMGTVLAAPTLSDLPHLPQTIDCPNSDIHVYINTTAVDRKEYTFVDWNAANLQDCVEKCFGNHFCYSIRYDSSLDKNCGLYYFAAYNCSNQALTKSSTIEYKGGSITLDCIRCPGRGDFVTAPPFSSIGEQTIVSETAVLGRGQKIAGKATEITHNSEQDGKSHGATEGEENKDEQNDQVKKTEEETKGGKEEVEGSGEKSTGHDAVSGETSHDEEGTEATTEGTLSREGAEPGVGASAGTGTTSAPEGAESTDGSTASPAEGEEGEEASTLSPSESSSVPAGGEKGTVEGSGEEEATTSASGESNGEAESVTDASGEGSPEGEESSTAPTGAAGQAREGTVEGSGEEGSGTNPEFAAQEEGEAEKAEKGDVETTTAWSGHTEQPRVCNGNLRFVPSAQVDLDTVQLLINSTKANSPAECAKICYEHNCGFAYYEPSTFVCQFMANTEDMVDTATCPTDLKDSKYQAEFRTDVASTMDCVVCAKDSEISTAQPALRPVSAPRRGSYPACIISFQASEGDHSSFPFYKSLQVKGLNECARHCFIGECSQSVYNPKTKECRLGSNPRDTCNNLPLIQKVPTPSEEVLMQCFRCIPEDTLAAKGTVSETTGYREPPTAAESIDESGSTANKEEKESAATTAEPTTATEAATEAALEAATTEAATAEAATTEVAESGETTTIAGTGEEITVAEALPEGVTEAPEEESTVATTESTTTEAETTPIGGEEVEVEEASGEEATTPSGGEGEGTTGEKETATGEEHEATTTGEVEGSGMGREGTPEDEEGKEGEATTAAAAAGKEGEEGAAATTPAAEGETTEGAIKGERTITEGKEGTTAGGEGAEATTVAGEGATTVGGEEGASTLTPEESATSEGPGEMSKAIEMNDRPLILASEDLDFGKSCVIKFQAASFDSRPSSLIAPFEKSFPVDSIELCATRCFQDGCSSAKYEPESKTCHLAYEDKPVCDRTELQLRMTEVKGDMWIHCVNCYPEKSVVQDVLAPLSKNATGEEKPEGEGKSMLEKVVGAVSSVVDTVADKVTGEKHDVLHNGCIVNFQTSLASENTEEAVEYLPPFKTRYAHRCATKCFQEGCGAATFNPTTNECSLGYGKFVKCNNSPLLTTALELKETVVIHCMSCIHHKPGEGGVDLVVLSPDDARIHLSESQDVPSEEVEGSGVEAVTPSTKKATTVAGAESATEGAEAATAESKEEGAETTVAGEEATTVSGAGVESTTGEAEAATTAESTEGGEATTVSAGGAESTTGEATTVSSETNGGSLGEEGSGVLEKEGHGRVAEIPLDDSGVEIPAGVNIGDVSEKVNGTKTKAEEGGKFKVGLPTDFSIDAGVGRVNVDGKTEMKAEGTTAAPEGTTAAAGEGEASTPSGEGAIGGSTVASAESTSETSAVEGMKTGEEAATTAGTSVGGSTVAPEATTGEEGEATTAAEGEETTVAGGEATTVAGGEATTEAEGESTTAAGAESTTVAGAESTTGHGVIHPAKEFEATPLHPAGGEIEVGSAETTTAKGKEGESTTAKAEEGTTTEEGPAFVQSSADEDEEEEKEEELITADQKQRQGTTPKTTETATVAGKGEESATGTILPAGEAEKTTVSSEGGESTVAPESTTGATEGVESSTSEGAESSTAAAAAEPSTTVEGAAASTDAATTATSDLQHREGILEKALATANPALTTKGEEGTEATTVAAESSDLSTVSGESTVAPTTEGTVEGTVLTTEGGMEMAASIDEKTKEEEKGVDEEMAKKGEVAQTGEKGISISHEGSTSSPSESSTISTSSDITPTSTVPTPADLAKAIHREHGGAEFGQTGQRGSEEKAVEEVTTKGEVAPSGEKGISISHEGSTTSSPSESSTISSSSDVTPTATVPSPADLAKAIHREHGGAEFGQTGQRGSEEKGVEEVATKGEVKQSGEKGAAAASVDASSTFAPSDAASGEITTPSTEGLAKGETLESTTELAAESTVAPVESTSAAGTTASSETTDESSTSIFSSTESSEGSTSTSIDSSSTPSESSTSSVESSTHADHEGLIQKALATAGTTVIGKEETTVVPTATVPSPADLAKAIHREHGGAEFGQTGQRGTEEGEIKSTTVSAVEATAATGESLDGGVDRALAAIGEQQTKTTTEPPVQAVKDLLDALASGDLDRSLIGKKVNATGTEAGKIIKGTETSDGATPINQKHEGQTFFEHDHTVDITTLHAIDDSIVTVPSPQGISKNCDGGRLEFQFVPAGSLPRLNVTNDVPARTPADCARKCHEMKGCTTAGYIPTPSAEIANGVCLLTSDDEVCISKEDAVPQHASVTAFVISCIRCTQCSYTLSHMTLASNTAKFQHIATVTTIGECAEVCHGKKCTFAQYDATTNTCALSMEASLETGCNKVEPAIAVKGSYPVRLECVQCRD